MPFLLEAIAEGKLAPDVLITHRLPLSDAAAGYRLFDEKREECRKVVLTP
jgi:threonine dehydrogenase-like Zn-dependent dehydrogenase